MGIRVRKNKMAPYGTYGGTVSRKWLPWYVVLLCEWYFLADHTLQSQFHVIASGRNPRGNLL